MSLLNLFQKTKPKIFADPEKWNKMCDMWVKGEMQSPYSELMTYQGEVYNGGHYQYFDNVGSEGTLEKDMKQLEAILPSKFRKNLKKAYKAYLILEENDDENEKAEDIIAKCDDTFYDNEGEINQILERYAGEIEL
ncbi:MAG: DUF4375 domain-containing protein [Ruminococcaceae bacterium]|nr:DUF4375 domain-containing protein [Oscillospiraceae bacterium]